LFVDFVGGVFVFWFWGVGGAVYWVRNGKDEVPWISLILFVTASTSPSGVLSVIDGMMVMISRKRRD
jgi:hypothetical protein